jgi:hypothetical protein
VRLPWANDEMMVVAKAVRRASRRVSLFIADCF